MDEHLNSELPFATLTDEELNYYSSLNVNVNSCSAYSFLYCLTEDYADKFDSDVNPAPVDQMRSPGTIAAQA